MHIVLYHSHDFGRSWGEPTTVPCAHRSDPLSAPRHPLFLPPQLLFQLQLASWLLDGSCVFDLVGCRIGPAPRPSLRPCSVRHNPQSCTYWGSSLQLLVRYSCCLNAIRISDRLCLHRPAQCWVTARFCSPTRPTSTTTTPSLGSRRSPSGAAMTTVSLGMRGRWLPTPRPTAAGTLARTD